MSKWFGTACALIAAQPTVAGALMPAVPAPSVVRATPALWEVRDADTVIYLFGTFHSLDARTVWFDSQVRDAFDRSEQLVLETVVPTNPQGLRPARAAATVVENGVRRPAQFMIQTRSAVDQNRAAGLTVDRGVDAVLRRVAEERGKRVGGLELFADQLSTLAGIKATSPTLSSTRTAIPAITAGDLLNAWTTGNTGAMSTMLSGFEAKAPDAYRTLIADRNARWGQWVADRLEQPGTVFVAVGSGHLAGKDSMQEWLLARGIEATRVG
ncbi:TraB/GumN family protein [Sphingomonas sp. LY29]|uniref:TraB/GumN family protein n=1 Tax=Sphingomonas sp. LY29 TaxID=3095341 RepID=UPI002D79E5E6|nr:TraB/GumN family protein [Sphingomonas sp. LY29]WRP25825.1 TraB/GumN family protein [Sphingomonas sp. LY29]